MLISSPTPSITTPRGKFIVLEGPDGAGKTTFSMYLVEALSKAGQPVVHTHEVGGTAVGAQLRKLIFAPPDQEVIDPVARLLMALASRIQNIRTNIEPLLAKGIHVVCDRFSLSTEVYQGRIDKLNFLLTDLENIQEMRFASLVPDHLLFFDADAEVIMERAASRAEVDNTHYKNDPVKTAAIVAHYRACIAKDWRDNPVGKSVTTINANGTHDEVRREVGQFVELFVKANPLQG